MKRRGKKRREMLRKQRIQMRKNERILAGEFMPTFVPIKNYVAFVHPSNVADLLGDKHDGKTKR